MALPQGRSLDQAACRCRRLPPPPLAANAACRRRRLPLAATATSSSSAATSSAAATAATADARRPTPQVKALCKRKIKAGNEFVEQDMSTMQAVDGRDALSKAIYSRLFDRLIHQIDSALAMGMEA